MRSQLLQEFNLAPNDYGWSGQFPKGPHRLFGKEICVEIHTRLIPSETKVLPPISAAQVALIHAIAPELPTILTRVEKELVSYNQKFDGDFQECIKHPHVWLNSESNDGESWTFVIGREDNPDFGYHAEYKGTQFIELWAGD